MIIAWAATTIRTSTPMTAFAERDVTWALMIASPALKRTAANRIRRGHTPAPAAFCSARGGAATGANGRQCSLSRETQDLPPDISEDPAEKDEVADQVALGQPQRLLEQPIGPFAAQSAHPNGSSPYAAGLEVKQCADGKKQTCSRLVPVLINPQFLQRVAHAHKDAVRA